MNARKVALLIIIAALVAAYFALDLGRFLTLESVKAQQAAFAALYAEHTVGVVAAYFIVYVVLVALSVPGATVMSLLGGGLFGFWMGLVIISFASTIGATLATAVARFILRDWVQGRFGDRLAAVNRGVEREGAFYLFTMRLIPAFPFFAINLAMGLTRMPLSTYYWVSQVGMLPGTMVYVNAGRELAGIESLSGILSPSLVASFAALGLFPLVARRVIVFVRARRGLS
ncbi:putative membrane protein YdjX (TVP38/TMEM64 family) [Desulfobaculum xiamenense]|uniref:TVP38/TMEM64 family membrane protein n=1 Tax=Desulfobaculum xiamenense TaxID=995050 RepID=A0A846QPC9_9BACT|nr:putative membrane protein YdjX (TVP38/TMEM64 family) [Desulfobaculum xiamenense]